MTDDGALAASEVVFGSEPLRVSKTAFVGDATAGTTLLTTTAVTARVTVKSSSRQLTTFQDNPEVLVVLADGRELAASVRDIDATEPGEDGSFGYEVVYDVFDDIDEAQPVKVRIEEVLAEDALTVPVDALVALAEGGYAVEVVTESGDVLRAVEVLEFDDTRVAITGDLVEGDLVVVPS